MEALDFWSLHLVMNSVLISQEISYEKGMYAFQL